MDREMHIPLVVSFLVEETEYTTGRETEFQARGSPLYPPPWLSPSPAIVVLWPTTYRLIAFSGLFILMGSHRKFWKQHFIF